MPKSSKAQTGTICCLISTKISFRDYEDSQQGNENLPCRSVCPGWGSWWGQMSNMRQDWFLSCCIQNTCWQVLSPPCCEVGAPLVLSATSAILIKHAWYLQRHTLSILSHGLIKFYHGDNHFVEMLVIEREAVELRRSCHKVFYHVCAVAFIWPIQCVARWSGIALLQNVNRVQLFVRWSHVLLENNLFLQCVQSCLKSKVFIVVPNGLTRRGSEKLAAIERRELW